ncbi:MAG: hypothetical protein WCS70_10415 [Verrucomicrobiota bacterium]
MEDPAPVRQPASAGEVFRDYGIGTVFLVVWEIWCIRDGWFNPGYEHITFSRAMAWISGPFLLFCSVMATSAGLTLLKAKRQKQNPPPP